MAISDERVNIRYILEEYMRAFLDEDFLLYSDTARRLYHDYAKDSPILDYHCHLSPKDMAEHRTFANITQLWLEADHYKWRGMRALGIDEELITGSATDKEKFMAWAGAVPQLVGSPLYHWVHLELARYFDIHEPLSPKTAEHIWTVANERLAQLDVIGLLRMQRVKAVCTTDDPMDELEYHKKIAADESIDIKVYPSFRPDKYLCVKTSGYKDIDELKVALSHSLDRFCALGCRGADHGFARFVYDRDSEDSQLLLWLGQEYFRRDMVMQLHIGPIRNQSPRILDSIGVDAGGDSVGLTVDPFMLGAFLGDLEREGMLPRTILYNLNPADNTVLSTMAGSFAPRVQYGAAWWFLDTIRGMSTQIDELMETNALARSVGMLTDSRSFSSFTRHEYYRRILCDKIGTLVESGQYLDDIETLGAMVRNICYENARQFFGIE